MPKNIGIVLEKLVKLEKLFNLQNEIQKNKIINFCPKSLSVTNWNLTSEGTPQTDGNWKCKTDQTYYQTDNTLTKY